MIIEESDFLRPRCTHAQKSWRVLELRPIWVSLALQRITSEVATRYFSDTRPIPTACSASWLDQRQKKTASCVNIKSAAHPAGSPVCARPPTGVHRPKNSGCIRRWKRKKSADGAKEKWRKNHSIFFPYPSRPANSFRNNKRSWAEFMSAKSLNNNSSNIQVVRLETWTFWDAFERSSWLAKKRAKKFQHSNLLVSRERVTSFESFVSRISRIETNTAKRLAANFVKICKNKSSVPREFTTERLLQSSRTQKTECRVVQELSGRTSSINTLQELQVKYICKNWKLFKRV